MVNYNCRRCGYQTNIKTILIRHLNRKKKCRPVLEDITTNNLINELNTNKIETSESKMNPNESKMNPNESKMNPNESKMNPNESKMNPNESNLKLCRNYMCRFCNKSYSTNSNLNKHLKKCKDSEEYKNLIELVNRLNDQLVIKDQQLNEELKKRDKQIDEQNKQINELIKKAGITQNIQNNIKILAYKNTDISHLTDQDYIQCLNRSNMCIPQLIKKIHFDPQKPENHNVYISNIKNKYVMIYDGNRWILHNQDETIDDLIDANEYVLEQKLEEWIENGKDYPEIMKKFNRYLEKKEKDDVLNKIKEEIKLVLFNNRKAIDV